MTAGAAWAESICMFTDSKESRRQIISRPRATKKRAPGRPQLRERQESVAVGNAGLSVEILQPDVTWSGGLTAALRISGMAEERGLRIIPHRGGSLYGLPIPLTRGHCPLAESFGVPGTSTDLMMAMTPEFEDGDYLASDKPGFGTRLTEGLVLEHVNREYDGMG